MSSELRVDKIVPTDGVPTGGGGGIVQIKQTVVSVNTFNTTSTSKVDITGMNVSITPKFNTSKILISSHLSYGGNNFNFYCDLLRGSTRLFIPSSGNNPCTIALCGITLTTYQIFNSSFQFLDSPATTSELTYKLQIAVQAGGGEFYLNRSKRNNAADSCCSSSITAMEVSA
tara:strand:+ start:326 stop:841 length:516 start_codon:yes stop_codon:yes gene_type:complete